MDIFEHGDYRAIIQSRVKELRKLDSSWSLRRLAAEIPIQYTYLSKSLNDKKTHLSEDHLFTVGKVLRLSNHETDYLLNLRAYQSAQNPARQQHLKKRLETMRRQHELTAQKMSPSNDIGQTETEMKYLFNPLCPIVHAALYIPEVLKNPRKLCNDLSLTVLELNEILTTLSALGFIELDKNQPGKIAVKCVLQGHIHYGPDHPMMRAHQQVLRHFCSAKLARVDEKKKKSFMVTFTANPVALEKIRDEFNAFMKRTEQIVGAAPSEGTYQLNFDLFEWLSY